MDEKKMKALSEIQRALGIIEGVSWAIDNNAAADSLQAAVGMIDDAIKEVLRDG